MKKIFKILIFVIVLIIGTIILIPFIYKDKVKELALNELNKNIKGEISFKDLNFTLLSSFPNFNLNIENLLVEVDSGIYHNDTLFYTSNLDLEIDLMSIINNQTYKIKSVVLDDSYICLHTKKDSTYNYNLSVNSDSINLKDTLSEKNTDTTESVFALDLNSFVLNNANIVYVDETLDFTMILSGVNKNTSFSIFGDSTKITSDIYGYFDIVNYESIDYIKNIDFNLSTILSSNINTSYYSIKNFDLLLNKLALSLKGDFKMNEDSYEMNLNLDANKSNFKDVLSLIPSVYSKDFENIKVEGELELNSTINGVYSESEIPYYNLKTKVTNGKVKYPELPVPVEDINMDLYVESTGAGNDDLNIELKKFYARADKNTLNLKLNLKEAILNPYLNMHIESKVNLESLRESMPFDNNQDLKGSLNGKIDLKGDLKSLEEEKYENFISDGEIIILDLNYPIEGYNDLKIKECYLKFSPEKIELTRFESIYGKSDASLTGNISNYILYVFKDGKLNGTLNLKSNLLDVDDLMGESILSETEVKIDSSNIDDSMTIIEIPDNIDFVFNGVVNNIIYNKTKYSNCYGEIRINNKELILDDFNLNLLGGSISMNGYYTAINSEFAKVDFKYKLKNLEFLEFWNAFETMQKMLPIGKYIDGKFDSDFSINTSFDSDFSPIYKTLNSKISFISNDLTIKNHPKMIEMADKYGIDEVKSLSLKDSKILIEILNGRVEVKPIYIKAGTIQGKIEGSHVINESLDYYASLKFPSKSISQYIEAIPGFNNKLVNDKLELIAHFTGDISDPKTSISFGTDDNQTIANSVKNQIEDKINSEKDKVIDKAQESIDQAKAKAEIEKQKAIEKAKQEAEIARQKAEAEAKRIKEEADRKAKEEKDKLKNKVKGLIK